VYLTASHNQECVVADYIPADLVEAFRKATRLLQDWTPNQAEPVVLFDGNGCSIGSIAELAATYDDPMPEDIFTDLCRSGQFGRRPEDRSFAAGGLFLRRLYNEAHGFVPSGRY
jgi:hypothetical protein